MDSEQLKGLAHKIASKDCTPLERFNIKTMVALQGIDDATFQRLIEEQKI